MDNSDKVLDFIKKYRGAILGAINRKRMRK